MYPDGLKAYTENTITDFNKLYNQLQKAKIDGFTIEYSEINDYTSCIAVPLFKASEIIASISVSIPTFRVNGQ